MKISYNWLQEYFQKEIPNPKDLADLLNIRAFEVEEIEEKEGDSIFEIKVSPDRAPDCLSHAGIAREVSVHIKQSLIEEEISKIENKFEIKYSINAQENSCVRYMAREIKNVVVGQSPIELKNKLESIGQRSINTIVDITNLVMHQIGQPMHAFDSDKLTGNKITIGSPTQTHFVTLDNKEVDLSLEDITIQDETDNLAIAGVKGGKKAEVDNQTKNILLESANFFPVKVRKTSKQTGIQNDSSKRYENGLTPKLTEKALNLASYYIQKYASNDQTQFSNIIDFYPRPQNRKYIVGLDTKHVSNKIGVEIPDEKIKGILESIGIEVEEINIRENILKNISTVIGKPYTYGASVLFDAPETFDCSSLVSYLYSISGVYLPRTSIDQLVFSKKITKEELEFGDLVFNNSNKENIHFETKEFLPGTKFELGVDHVGMYLGDGKILHSSRYLKNGTEIENLNDSEQFQNIVAYGRVIDKENISKYVLHIPYERLDLKTEIDIIEEIGRIYGYEQITPVAPVLTKQPEGISTYEKINTIKSYLIDLGFNEVITYTFQKKGDISVIKPLANDKGYLRTDLIKGLTTALDLNFKNKELFAIDCIKIFEIGNVFTQEGEKLMLGIGVKSANKKQKPKVILEEAIKVLSEKINTPINISVNDQQEVVEIDLSILLKDIKDTYNSLYKLQTKPYTPFSLYPFMTRDVAVWAHNSKTKEDIENIIKEHGTNLLLRYDLFDTYTTENKTSYGYRIVFQSNAKTLTDEEIQPIMEKIYSTLQSDSDFEIR